ncbi:YheC/YheD family protein [Paenibacillus sp. PL2-23]|uniref:YheC/YheD family endospore coat-associated protein n=1 Tax=Paenibacillus sp. PL2-23 TaxID=2100729 RepID=UPI0030F4F7FC
MKPSTPLVFGILASSHGKPSDAVWLPEPRLCRELSLASVAAGVETYVFSAADYKPGASSILGLQYVGGEWVRRLVPLPDIVYDRSFYRSAEARRAAAHALAKLKEQRRFQLLNSKLPGKLSVHHALAGDAALAPYLPRTVLYSERGLRELLHAAGGDGLVLKPAAGMQGRGIVRIMLGACDDKPVANGRTRSNRPFQQTFAGTAELTHWLRRFMGRSAYLVQPCLRLRDGFHRPFDIRVLMQKDGSGEWKLTGMAARRGGEESLTSNLHGGGEALPAHTLLTENFGKLEAERLRKEIHTISGHTAKRLETSFGRFGELAFDCGIEPSGKLWLLEANSKPGRDAFRQIGDETAQRLSIQRPLRYARYIMHRAAPTFVSAEFAYDLVQPERPVAITAGQRSSNVQEVHR